MSTLFRNRVLGWAAVLLLCAASPVRAQFYSVRTNGLMWLTGTPNVGFGVAVSKKWSVDAMLGGNPIATPTFKMQGVFLQEGVRNWLYEANAGFFWGIHFTQAIYDVGNAEFYNKGFLAGAGVSVGYALYLSRRWNLTFELGGSALYMQNTRAEYEVPDHRDEYIYRSKGWVLAPTKAEVSIVYLF